MKVKGFKGKTTANGMILQLLPNQTTCSGSRASLRECGCVCSCFSLELTTETLPFVAAWHLEISWIKALPLQLSSIFTTQEDRQKGTHDIMCSQNISALGEEKFKPNKVLTVRRCLCAGCVGRDLCPLIHYDVKVHCRDFQHVWQATLTITLNMHLHQLYLFCIKMYSP